MCKFICTRWACDLTNWTPTLTQLTHAIAAIQLEERERIMRFHFWDDFLASLVGRLLMRKYVSKMSGLHYNKVHFERDERGKPYWQLNPHELEHQSVLRSPTELSFNVSHQGSMVILAGISLTDPLLAGTVADFGIGADVMKIEYSGGKPLREFFRLMNKKFSHTEWQHIMRGCESAQLKSFMRHWCLKEAYVKELGVGITVNLQKISFKVDEDIDLRLDTQPLTNTTLQCDDVPMNDWSFEEHLLKPNYCAAIAFRNCHPHKVDKFEFLNMEHIIVDPTEREFSSNPELNDYCERALKKQRRQLHQS